MPYCRSDNLDSIPTPGSNVNIPSTFEPLPGPVPENPLVNAKLPSPDKEEAASPASSGHGSPESEGTEPQGPPAKQSDPSVTNGVWCRVRHAMAPLVDTLRDIAQALVADFRSSDIKAEILARGQDLAQAFAAGTAIVSVVATMDLIFNWADFTHHGLALGSTVIAMPLCSFAAFKVGQFLGNRSNQLAERY